MSSSIIYEDENVLLLNKKTGLLCHPDNSEYIDTLLGRLKRYLFEKGEFDPANEQSFQPSLCNRIDRNTCGIVIAAKTAEALRIINEKIKNREIDKQYLCIVIGQFEQKRAVCEAWLRKNESKNRVNISKNPSDGAKKIITEYEVLKAGRSYSLLKIKLHTGRTHQIRAHMAYLGHPVLGDGKYGKNEFNKAAGLKKQCLCSYRLEFDFKTDAGALNYLKGKSFEINDVWFEREFDSLDSR